MTGKGSFAVAVLLVGWHARTEPGALPRRFGRSALGVLRRSRLGPNLAKTRFSQPLTERLVAWGAAGLIVAVGWAGTPAAEPPAYCVGGTLKYETFAVRPYDPPGWHYSASFTGLIAQARWYLSVRPTEFQSPDPRVTVPYEHVLACDGTNLYGLNIHSPPAPTRRTSAPTAASKPPPTATIEYGPVPRRLNSSLAHLWLAVASGYAFHTVPPEAMPAPWAPPLDTDLPGTNMGVRLEVRPATAAPFIPNAVSYVRADNGAPLLRMEAKARTKVAELSIPTEVICTSFSEGALGSRTTVVVTQVAAASPAFEAVPRLPDRAHISDFRFAQSNPPVLLQYAATDWMPYREAQELYAFRVRRMKEPGLQANAWRRRGAVIWLAVFFAGFPVLAGLYVLYARKRSTTTKQPEKTQL